MDEIVLGKRHFVSIKGQLSLIKRHLGSQEWHLEVEYLPHQKLSLAVLIQIKKKCFFFPESTLFNSV